MPDAIRSLIIESDPETARVIELLGRRSGSLDVRWTAGSVKEGADIVRKFRPDMAIVEVNGNPAAAIGPLAKEFPNLYILALSATREAEYALETMRAGAHDLLCKPLREVDLSIAIEKARKARVRKDPAERRGKILSVFSNKGGNGTTTIAANLADALVRLTGKKVAVVDLVLSHGDVTMFFNVNSSYSILDLAKNAEKADYDFLALPHRPARRPESTSWPTRRPSRTGSRSPRPRCGTYSPRCGRCSTTSSSTRPTSSTSAR